LISSHLDKKKEKKINQLIWIMKFQGEKPWSIDIFSTQSKIIKHDSTTQSIMTICSIQINRMFYFLRFKHIVIYLNLLCKIYHAESGKKDTTSQFFSLFYKEWNTVY
jgi:hypothetical protein